MMISLKRKAWTICGEEESEELPDLPEDVICVILSRTSIEPLLRFRSACKSWYGLTNDPYFINLQLNTAQQRYILSPRTANHTIISSLFLVDGGDTREIPIENVRGKPIAVVASCNGLLCMVSSSRFNMIFIYNPITRECLKLPRSKIERNNKYCDIGFGFDPKNEKYKVVRFCNLLVDRTSKYDTMGEIITLGENSWRALDVPYGVRFDHGTKLFNYGLGPVFLNGAFHWIINRNSQSSSHDHILALDISEETFQSFRFPPDIQIPNERYPMNHLVNLGGYVALVEYYDQWRMRIWQLLGSKAKGYSLGRAEYKMIRRPSFMKNFAADFKLVGMVNDDCFLLVVRDHHYMDEPRWHVIRYFPAKNRYSINFSSRIPRFFDVISFQPSLVSVSAAINSGMTQ